MRLTTRTSYGIRALINIAMTPDKTKPVSLKDISRAEKISCVYLEQIFNRMKRAGVVKSVRGPKGGYVLAKDPSELSVLEVAVAVEDKNPEKKCLCGKVDCEKAINCASRMVWEEAIERTKETLSRHSLGQLTQRTQEAAVIGQNPGV
jgi:Rrf2 family iron-sulfur cluster assembly transcriptional regulator